MPGPGPTRSGLVRASGAHGWRDDVGVFWPLGATLFWALDGWIHERERLKENLAFLQKKGWDYVRILGDVGWDGQQIDSSAPLYEQLLGELLDCTWQDYGIRTEVTIWGGSSRDPVNAAERVRRVTETRRDHVLFIEPANESFQNGPPAPTIDQMVAELRQGPHLVASSCVPPGADPHAWFDARRQAGAQVGTLHLDRQEGDEDWRFVRQPWDFASWNQLLSNNEGKGPRSSISQCDDVARLVMYRAMSIVCTPVAFVLHNGAGVTGKVDPAHNRPANLWEVPGIDAIMDRLRALDQLLPAGVEDWVKTTQHGSTERVGPHVLLADGIWSDGDPHGVSRNYGAVNGADFVHLLLGIKDHVGLSATQPVQMEAIDVATGETLAEGSGTSFTISTGRSDSGVGCIVRGKKL